ncbi:MAG: envelope stress response membrane protein PspB [Pseudomonadota bacterium]|nr:envelope stress response membrane protein PspB [Pseudomonadota bacterium]
MDEDIIVPAMVFITLFVVLPWIVLHYVTKWKAAATLTREDENLLDELHDLARRLDDRMCTLERILHAENPNWRSIGCDPIELGAEDLRPEPVPLARSNQPKRRAK